MSRLLAFSLVGLFVTMSVAAPANESAIRRLARVDQAALCPGFAEFRARLLTIIERHDDDALLDITDPGVTVEFGSKGAGRDEFKRRWLSDQSEGDVWAELGQVLALGGRCSARTTFDAPYVSTDWPDDLDAFDYRAVTGSHVRLRRAPNAQARVVSLLDFAIVRLQDSDSSDNSWASVATATGRRGFVARRYLRSAIDMRATFESGPWRMTVFIGGD